ncbi:MAG: patatin-like phospholipase family protein [Candidatus Saccharicenans sp.]
MKKEKTLKWSELIKPLKETLLEKIKDGGGSKAEEVEAESSAKAENSRKRKTRIRAKTKKGAKDSGPDKSILISDEARLKPGKEEAGTEEVKWGLVLMGGGARAIAHIGVLEALVEHNLIPPVITGTSMGAVIGGLFAAGYFPPELEKISRELSYHRLSQLRRKRLPIPDTLFDYLVVESYQRMIMREARLEKADPIELKLRELVGDIRIEDLSLKFGCNAVDLVSGREVNFTSGPLYRALRASLAFPFVIRPARFSGMLLVDGGLLNNCPVRLARQLGALRVFAPDVHRPLKRIPASRFTSAFIMVHRMVQVVLADSTDSKLPEADLMVKVNPGVDTFDFATARRVINLGKKITLENIQAIKEMIASAREESQEER